MAKYGKILVLIYPTVKKTIIKCIHYVEENGVMEYKTYSVQQIGFLYLLDPLGIEYYMRNHVCYDKDIMSGEFLSYKDEVMRQFSEIPKDSPVDSTSLLLMVVCDTLAAVKNKI